MKARVGVLVFPGTNSEEETVRACRSVGLESDAVHWNADLDDLRRYDAYVLPGGFAYEDRVRAGAIAAHDRVMRAVREGAEAGKLVLGICNGAQILLESGLVPAVGGDRRRQAGFARNAPLGKFRSTHVHMKLVIPPERCAITAHLVRGQVIPAWASHAEGRLAAHDDMLDAIARDGHLAFVYTDSRGNPTQAAVPNGSALGAAGLVNDRGNVLAIMPHPEREMLLPINGMKLFWSFATALGIR